MLDHQWQWKKIFRKKKWKWKQQCRGSHNQLNNIKRENENKHEENCSLRLPPLDSGQKKSNGSDLLNKFTEEWWKKKNFD